MLAMGCDVSQKMPQTGSPPAPGAVTRPAAVPEATAGEKSIRLFGPGVNRKRQTRV
jgi:hypothetical protein